MVKSQSLAKTLSLLLHGTPIVTYGDELGLESDRSSSDVVNPYMKWDNSNPSCGFTSNSAKAADLKQDCTDSVKYQTAHGYPNKLVKLFKSLIKLKDKEAFLWGEDEILNRTDVFSFIREAKGFDKYLVAIHLDETDDKGHLIDFHNDNKIPETGIVEYFYSNKEADQAVSDFQIENTIKTDRIFLKYGNLLIIKFEISPKTNEAKSSGSSH